MRKRRKCCARVFQVRKRNGSGTERRLLHTGGCGYLDADGDLFICGRIKNVIISGGLNISPEEIETVLMKHSAVSNVLLTGEKSEILGEYHIACVVTDGICNEEELKKYCKLYLSEKIPKRIVFTEVIPKVYNGKIKGVYSNEY